MYMRTYARGTEAQGIPPNYGGTALAVETNEKERRSEDTGGPVCRENEISTVNEASEEYRAEDSASKSEKESTERSSTLFESFATGDLLLLAVAALLSQSEKSDNELLIVLLLLLLGN